MTERKKEPVSFFASVMLMKLKINRILSAVLILFTAILSSCGSGQQKNKYSAYSMDYFDTVISIVGYENTEDEFNETADRIFAQFEEYHKLYSIYHRFDGLENLCTVNELSDGAHRTVTVDGRIIDMLKFAVEMYGTTDGTVNVAMGSVLSGTKGSFSWGIFTISRN